MTELACAEPGCPPREAVVLVMGVNTPALKLRIHKAMPDVLETDVSIALAAAEIITAMSSSR